MAATEHRFNAIDGTPVHYWRWTDGTAGSRSEQRTFASTHQLHERLVVWVRDLRSLAETHGGLRGMQRIVSAGAYVNKPGQHGLGQAFDLDEVQWANGSISPYRHHHAARDRAVVRRYLALDAVCRRHFRWVLDAGYNAAHRDHLHLDFAGGAPRCDRASQSDTAFVQLACNAHLGARLRVDGVWGRATQEAFAESLRRLAVGGDPHVSSADWRSWLGRAAACGFANTEFAPPPAPPADPIGDLLRDLLG
jgi:hypothetical protein